ncbi:MAG: ATP-grasp domain-containing protein [Muribaculaceae bacterium]|nr:ATP-grasp domain-containing protein [Muribaculaceae bacterium]
MDTTKKKIMVLAGGNDQAALIQELKRYFNGDVEVVLLDMLENVKARPFADRFMKISTMDREAVLRAAREEHIDYILTACGDQPLSTMAFVSARMGLPCYLSEDDVRDLTNKIFMKKKMVANGIPTARFQVVNSANDDVDLKGFNWPLIVKPVDSNGSKGVKKVLSINEFKPFLEEALSYSISKNAIVEEFKTGDELSVDAYIEGTNAKILTVSTSKKIKENKDSFTIIQSEFPPSFKFSMVRISEIVQNIATAFNLHDTPLLVQLIVSGNDYNVVEFSARMGGGSKYHIIDVLTGVSIMRTYVEMVMGGRPTVEPQKLWNNALMNYVYCYPGTFSSLKNFDDMVEKGKIHSYFTYKMPNSQILKSTTSSDRVAGFLIVGNSQQEVEEKLSFINSTVEVLDINGHDIMRHDLFNKQ